MRLNREQKKFAYGRYVFYDNIKSILDFMDPVSKFDEEIENIKAGYDKNYAVIWLFVGSLILLLCSIFSNKIGEFFEITHEDFLVFLYILCSVLIFVCYFTYLKFFKNVLKYDVDNDLNNFVIPFLQKVDKYVDKNTEIKLVTDLSRKLNKKYLKDMGTFDETLIIPWFSAELPFKDNFKVYIDLTYVINCYGKLKLVRSADLLKGYKMNVDLRFVFPKTHFITRFDRIRDIVVEWEDLPKDYSLKVSTVVNCNIEFYRTIDGVLGLLFDNDICNDIIDEVYAKVTGFDGFIQKKYAENSNGSENDENSEENRAKELIDLEKLLEEKTREIDAIREAINGLKAIAAAEEETTEVKEPVPEKVPVVSEEER